MEHTGQRRPGRRRILTGVLGFGAAMLGLGAVRRARGRRETEEARMDAARQGGAAPNALDRITVDASGVRDGNGRQVTLRGLVTITSFVDGRRLELTDADFARLRGWGFNAQVIRLEGCRLGVTPECAPDDAYLDLLGQWTTAAEAHGIYTIFKMTTYDAPSWGAGRAFDAARWQLFWDNVDGQRDRFLEGWQRVWRRFAGRSAVAGYDVLNEPHAGARTPSFTRDYLAPFYNRAATALRAIDAAPALLFQPETPLGEPPLPIDDPRALFAPHFYPARPEQYERRMEGFRVWAAGAGAPFLIGEYGNPNQPVLTLPAFSAERERDAAVLLDRFALGSFRPWYVAGPFWSVLNADGREEREKLDILSRPYPQRIGGTVSGWTFDFDSRRFDLRIEPVAGASAPTEMFVAARRHYPDGFVVELDGVALVPDAGAASGLRPLGPSPSGGSEYDAGAEILRIDAQSRPMAFSLRPA